MEGLGDWYHRIDLGDGTWTPGDRNQGLVFSLYAERLPDLEGLTVLDLGANAGGMSIEFAKRGAEVTAVEVRSEYLDQARYVLDRLGLTDRITLTHADIYDCEGLGTFDIVCHLGLSYHLRHPQLALDMISGLTGSILLASSQTIDSQHRVMRNRAATGPLQGWEPSETLFLSMLDLAGFRDPVVVSTAPHPGESRGNICGNRSYFMALAGTPVPLPFIDRGFVGDPKERWHGQT